MRKKGELFGEKMVNLKSSKYDFMISEIFNGGKKLIEKTVEKFCQNSLMTSQTLEKGRIVWGKIGKLEIFNI